MTAFEIVSEQRQLDITAPEEVEISIREDGEVIWVNVDGLCMLRVCRLRKPVIIDDRRRRLEGVYVVGTGM